MKAAIFTPTQRPGIDITFYSLLRQKTEAKIHWFVLDELLDTRWNHKECEVALSILSKNDIGVTRFHLVKKKDHVRNLAAGYNQAIEFARMWDADVLISLQDYIWVPEDGVQKWVDMYQAIDHTDKYKAVYTGICSITSDPEASKIVNPDGPFTIFETPYDDKPNNIEWLDVRYKSDHRFASIPQIEYETNWSCIPRSSLYNEDLFYDEEFDKAVAYENQDYAYKARDLGIDSLINMKNQVLSLPHKKYFAESWAYEQPLTNTNRELCESKWGHFQGLL